MFIIPFPYIDKTALSLGPVEIRWYGIAYAAGILLGYLLIQYLNTIHHTPSSKAHKVGLIPKEAMENIVLYSVLGIILGGRVGYVLFYHPQWIISSPLEVLKIWEGGMSFHGGFIGFSLSMWIFCRRYKVPFWAIMDMTACAAPIGLFFGRIANFINAELYGRVTDVPWAIIFPNSDYMPRHPSQLYEAGLEGIVLFGILITLYRVPKIRAKYGVVSGSFLIVYAIARLISELYREPDEHLGFFLTHYTMGTFLTIPMLVLGIVLLFNRYIPR